ncbi:MAG: ribonuclease R [Candidatus Cloacimonetes bacterium]|nr:ribonuclease R [Candidatus Cloacimonadota bacterium]
MYDNKLAAWIEKYLRENAGYDFKSGDIARAMGLKKHKRRDLEDTLLKMKKQRRINGKNKRYSSSTSTPSQEFTGKFDARPLARNRSFAFVIQEGRDIYISREDVMNAYHGDTVTVAIKFEGRDYLHGYITGIKERAREEVVGTLEQNQGKYFLIPDSSLIHTEFQVNDIGTAKRGEKVVCRITNWGNPEEYKLPAGIIIEVLGQPGDPDVEIMSVIRQNDLPLIFPEEVLKELDTLDDEISEKETAKRNDFRSIYTLTIDPASARDYDDAISLEKTETGYLLYVHIADVAHYVKPGTALFAEAAKRGNSFYFPRKVIPMLPELISNGLCSLRPEEDKLTVSVITELTADGTIQKQYAVESIINSNVRLNYEEVDELFAEKDVLLDSEAQNHLLVMRELSRKMQVKRIERGYLSLDLPETEYIFNDEGMVIDLQRSRETESHQLIENFMLTANEYIARQLSKYPTLFRIHEAPDADSIEDMKRLANVHKFDFEIITTLNHAFQKALNSLETEARHRVFDRIILRHLKRARYDTFNKGHFGLAMEYYTHFTSPIRRLCDLIVHHQIKGVINQTYSEKDKSGFSGVKLKEYAEIATERENLADNCEREIDQKNKLLFMKKHLGEEFAGVIVGIKSNIILVELDRYPVIGVVPISSLKDDHYEYHEFQELLLGTQKAQAIKLADVVKIQVVKIDDDIILGIIEK